jgi:hypothetical protein
MSRRFTGGLTRALLATALLCAMAGGAAAAAVRGGARAECPLMRLHDCCKRALRNRDARELAPARLCCVVNTPQPAPTGANYTFQPKPGAANASRPPATHAAPGRTAEHARAYAPPFRPSHSPPAYIRHAAFLI